MLIVLKLLQQSLKLPVTIGQVGSNIVSSELEKKQINTNAVRYKQALIEAILMTEQTVH